jgi:hypothetical protein
VSRRRRRTPAGQTGTRTARNGAGQAQHPGMARDAAAGTGAAWMNRDEIRFRNCTKAGRADRWAGTGAAHSVRCALSSDGAVTSLINCVRSGDADGRHSAVSRCPLRGGNASACAAYGFHGLSHSCHCPRRLPCHRKRRCDRCATRAADRPTAPTSLPAMPPTAPGRPQPLTSGFTRGADRQKCRPPHP